MTGNMKGEPESEPTVTVAAAMNEQGFLFQQSIREKIRSPHEGTQTLWSFIASEYPVTAANGLQTRVDMVLGNSSHPGVHICLECKRALAPFKRWIFFDRGNSIRGWTDGGMFLETLTITQRPVQHPRQAVRSLTKLASHPDFPLFNLYLEVATKRDGKVSATETIETAMRQVVQGQTGLMTKLWGFDSGSFIRSIPVVVTTAEIYEARFDHNKIEVQSGQIKASDLELEPLDFCGVHYRPDDDLALKTETPPTGVDAMGSDSTRFTLNQTEVSGNRRSDIHGDLTRFQMRTVFVVQAASINKFLEWADAHLTARS
jgi:hypothetical protein